MYAIRLGEGLSLGRIVRRGTARLDHPTIAGRIRLFGLAVTNGGRSG